LQPPENKALTFTNFTSMTKKTTRFIALLVAAVIFGGFLLYQYGIFDRTEETSVVEASSEDTAASGTPAPQAQVRAMRIRSDELRDYINVNGSTVPNEEVIITNERPGKIVEIRFKEGNFVKKDEVLVKLDDEELQAQRKKLVVQRALAEKIADRLQKLYEKEGVSLQDYEVARAEVDQFDADIALLGAQLEKTLVRAPFSGVVGLRQVSLGSYLSPGTPIVNLVSVQPIKIEFSVPEKYSTSIRPGSNVNFRLDGMENALPARVEAREPQIDADTRTLLFKASAPNPGGRILPGAFANVEVSLQEYDAALLIPTEAVVPELDGKKVFLYKSGKAESVNIETGIRRNEMIQVISGVEQGDTVITSGVLQIRPGAEVRPLSLE